MKLISTIQPMHFLDIVQKNCTGDVWFCSPEGDRLNLKSQLTHFVFITIALQETIFFKCWIECEKSSDFEILSNYIICED